MRHCGDWCRTCVGAVMNNVCINQRFNIPLVTRVILGFCELLLAVRTRLYFLKEDNKELDRVVTKAEINNKAEHILNDYGNSVLRMAYSYLHNTSDAEDVLQDTIIRFIKDRPIFESTAHEKAWVMRVAINISKNKIRYNKIRTTDELSEELVGEEKEDLAFVWEAVKSLPEKYREVTHLYYYEGYSTGQIATLIGKKEQTVRSLLHRARGKLKLILKEVYDFEE